MTALRLHVEGEHNDVALDAFIDVLRKAQQVLRELDSAISGTPRGKLEWKIVELGVNSADAVVEAIAPKEDARLPIVVGTNFVDGMSTIERGETMPPYFSERAVKRIGEISKKLGKGGVTGFEVELRNGDAAAPRHAELTPQAASSVIHLLAPKYTAQGSVLGSLGQISVHGRLTFNVYDALRKRAVRCRFDEEQFEQVREALRCRVIVSGTVQRNASGEPLRVEDPVLEVLRDREIPTDEIFGLDPGFSGGMSAGTYVQELRS